MTQPLISIIIPCYNYAVFLPDAVKSVCDQTYVNWECLIVDDGSTDNSKQVAEELATTHPRVYYHYKTNGGLSSARNYGIELAKGDYICFLDADDLFDKEKLDKQFLSFARTPAVDIVYGKAMFFETGNRDQLYFNKTKGNITELSQFTGSGDALVKLLVEKNITVVSAPLIKREVFLKTGGFDTSYKSYEDWQFWMRCALAGFHFKYENTPPVCTYIRFGHESMMSDKKKLVNAGLQLRKFMALHLPFKFQPYNYYRLFRSYIKRMSL